MEIPLYEPFYLDSVDALRAEITRLGLTRIPVEDDLTPLTSPLSLPGGSLTIPNRFCAQPISGHDANPCDGSPGKLTQRRYLRYAEGGFGLIWIESTAAGQTDHPAARHCLRLHDETVDAFAGFVAAVREAARDRCERDLVLILQLSNAPVDSFAHFPSGDDDSTISPPLLTDDEINRARDGIIHAATLAAAAGFDGVDVQACHGSIAHGLLGAHTRPGPFGGSFENRTRFLRETLAAIREQSPGLILATRLSAYDAMRHPHGFGVDASDYRKPDLSEPIQLAKTLKDEAAIGLLNVTATSPNLGAPAPQRAFQPHADAGPADEHPLTIIDRQLHLAAALRAAAPGLAVVGTGFSWLRQFLPETAAGAIAAGAIDLAGMGRAALACSNAPAQTINCGGIAAESACMVCYACNDLHREGDQPVGCVIRDSAVYGAPFQRARRYSPDHLEAEARRCHLCEAAPCITACPTGTDAPSFIRAWLEGDDRKAWEIIRASDVLPELTSRLSTGWLYGTGACVETALTGRPVPILDLQYAISWRARERGDSGVRLPDQSTGKRIAIIGGGPVGVAAAIRLLEYGHTINLFERSDRLGGTPELMIPASRFAGSGPEIDAALAPALAENRLHVHFGKTISDVLAINTIRDQHDAVLLAAGFWQETPLLSGDPNTTPDGVLDALTFLERAKRGDIQSIPNRVAVLAGGDCAMDAANTAGALGAGDVFIVFGGPRSEMHWHMPEGWFATPGIHAMMHCRPIQYETDGENGRLNGVRIHHTQLNKTGTLSVGLAIEAMGLAIADPLKTAFTSLGLSFTEDGRLPTAEPGSYFTGADKLYAAGALINGGDSISQCVAEGMQAASQIHQNLDAEPIHALTSAATEL